MTRSAISNACDELHERLRAAALHTPGGVLLETELAAIPDPLDTIIAQAAEIQRLTRERDEAIAQADARVAAAYEDAADRLQSISSNWDCGHNESRLCDCCPYAEQWELAAAEVRYLTPADATKALTKMLKHAEQNGQIKAGWVFADTNPEAQYIDDQENACPACGGSGHKDDATAALARRDAEMKAAGMREAAGIVQSKIPILHPEGPVSAEQQVEYEALGFSMEAILARAEEIEREAK